MNTDAHAAAIAAFFESLSPAQLAKLDTIYRDDACFKDPFNDVRGIDAIRRVYAHMFKTLEAPRFVVTRHIGQGPDVFLLWDFHFRATGLRRRDNRIRGATHLQLAPDGRIAAHRDYWDAAQEVYEEVPVLGAFMRWLKRRAAA